MQPRLRGARMPGVQQANASSAGSAGYAAGTSTSRHPFEVAAAREAEARRNNFVRNLPVYVQESVAALEAIDEEVANLEAQFRRERRQLERRFEALYAPFYARRAAVVAGESRNNQRVAEVPDFWLGAMKAETAVAANVAPKDEPALRYLKDVTCSTLQEAKGVGFCLQFYFSPNKYFSNHVLAKTYHVSGSDTEPVIERAEGTDIRWKPGMNLAATNGCTSFFRFFDTLRVSPDPAMINRVADWVESDYEIGRAFKDKLVPHAVRWFTGEAEDAEEFESDEERDAEEAADELEAARLELALDAAVASPDPRPSSTCR